jgi:hypothetical protein
VQRPATLTGSSPSVTTVHHAKRGGAVVLILGLFALGLATLPATAQAAGADPCANPTKSVTYSGATASTHGTVTGDTTVGSVTVTDNTDDTQTAQWPAVDSSYYYCRATGTAYLKSNGTSVGSWTVDNDGSRNAQFYDSNPAEFLNNITVTYAVGKAPAARRVSLPAYRSGQTFTIRDGIAPDGGAAANVSFGAKTDLPLFGDWNADGDQSPGVYRPGTRTFSLASDKDGQTVTSTFVFGAAGDKPVAGDFDGNGTETVGVYRPSTSTFYLTNDNRTVFKTVRYGTRGDQPLVGDWNGTGTDTLGVFRPSTGTFYRLGLSPIHFGRAGDLPVVGDWDANGTTTVGVVRGTTWYVSNNNRTGRPPFTFGPRGAAWLALTVTE